MGTCLLAHTGPGHLVPDLRDTGSLVHNSDHLRLLGSSSSAAGPYMSLHMAGHTLDTPVPQNTASLGGKSDTIKNRNRKNKIGNVYLIIVRLSEFFVLLIFIPY